ncbi:Protein of unknown function [Gryllus bimaculatus]|nr:Protein of unknown function [Gryllus bimaculatus]
MSSGRTSTGPNGGPVPGTARLPGQARAGGGGRQAGRSRRHGLWADSVAMAAARGEAGRLEVITPSKADETTDRDLGGRGPPQTSEGAVGCDGCRWLAVVNWFVCGVTDAGVSPSHVGRLQQDAFLARTRGREGSAA